MFSLREFIKKGLLDAVGKMANYQIILTAAGWLEKGVLEESDLSEIQAAIDTISSGENIEVEIPEEEVKVEETKIN